SGSAEAPLQVSQPANRTYPCKLSYRAFIRPVSAKTQTCAAYAASARTCALASGRRVERLGERYVNEEELGRPTFILRIQIAGRPWAQACYRRAGMDRRAPDRVVAAKSGPQRLPPGAPASGRMALSPQHARAAKARRSHALRHRSGPQRDRIG